LELVELSEDPNLLFLEELVLKLVELSDGLLIY